jgi:DNA (cytosine-5)-methyltransferase 1
MKHGSLFSGIGGFDLAAEWMGWENMFHCEWNPFGQRVLKHYWPNAESFTDITKTDFTKYANTIDILTGGFPCQPYSVAGNQEGTEDERHLWPEMLRAIQEIRPRWVVGENVHGLVSWNDGLVFEQVQVDLEFEGYNVQPVILPAAGVGAPHKRDRVWFVAYCSNTRFEEVRKSKISTDEFKLTTDTNTAGWRQGNKENERKSSEQFNGSSFSEINANPNSYVLQGGGQSKQRKKTDGQTFQFGSSGVWNSWQNFPSQPPVCNGNDGFPDNLDGVTFSKWRNESIKAGGNAIVPQVALQIFKTIEAYEQLQHGPNPTS